MQSPSFVKAWFLRTGKCFPTALRWGLPRFSHPHPHTSHERSFSNTANMWEDWKRKNTDIHSRGNLHQNSGMLIFNNQIWCWQQKGPAENPTSRAPASPSWPQHWPQHQPPHGTTCSSLGKQLTGKVPFSPPGTPVSPPFLCYYYNRGKKKKACLKYSALEIEM